MYIGHGSVKNKSAGTRIGVQKGSTLMKALSGVDMSDSFDNLKKQRRDNIVTILKDKSEGMTIKDIKSIIVNMLKRLINTKLFIIFVPSNKI